MIAALTGRVLFKKRDRVIIDVGGVGYEVFLTADALSRLPDTGEETFLHIHTQVRDDAIVLFGFPGPEDKELFLALISVSGVGPKLGLAVLAGLPIGELCRSIGAGDVKRLTTLPGVGKKTAERICMELKDKVGHLATDGEFQPAGAVAAAGPGTSSVVSDVLSALANLGYHDPVCRQALTRVKQRVGNEAFYELSLEEMLRECLRSLA
ncbi:MAG: Holliday junction branch migration protein RuvA [Desulfofustis sp.]|nr:Holliday junction branch migration protein RuvA [Desulfofustis sp.]